ncbi:MAG: hypothetical protein WDW38_001826 [Sanguina aurantia]
MDNVLQLRELQQRNAELVSALQSKDADLENLRDMMDAFQAQDVQAAKFIELSKKVRNLTLALERERTKVGQLQSDLASSSRGAGGGVAGLAAQDVEDVARSVVEQAAMAVDTAHRETAAWKEKASAQANKVSQMEQKVFTVEAEARKLQRALQRESADWKGRREVIISLKDQVRQLKAQSGLAADSRRDAGAKEVLQKMSSHRSQDVDRLTNELLVMKGELEAVRGKLDSAVSRRKTLESDLAGVKEKLAVVLDKTNNDDRLIAALKAELANLRQGARVAAVAVAGSSSSIGIGGPGRVSGSRAGPGSGSNGRGGTVLVATAAPDEGLWQEAAALRRQCRDLESQVERQGSIIFALHLKLQPHHSSVGAGLGTGCGTGSGSG